jgi:hypothetical protein
MSISREYLLNLSETPRDSARFYAECIIGDVKLYAVEGRTTYISPPFSRKFMSKCREILYVLCLAFPDVHIFTMRDARSTDTYIVLEWSTEYVYAYHPS